MEGKVKFYNEEKGYGFIEGENGEDYFVHITQVRNGVILQKNQNVTFEVQNGMRGPQAVDVAVFLG